MLHMSVSARTDEPITSLSTWIFFNSGQCGCVVCVLMKMFLCLWCGMVGWALRLCLGVGFCCSVLVEGTVKDSRKFNDGFLNKKCENN